MAAVKVDAETLRGLEPIRAFSHARLAELAALCVVDTVAAGQDPFRSRGMAGEVAYLIRGELALSYPDGGSVVIVGASDDARHPLGRRGGMFSSARAITDIQIVRIDDDLLDIMSTWDQLAEDGTKATAAAGGTATLANWTIMSGMFSVSNLKYGAFSQLPAAHIDELLNKFKRVEVKAGQVVIREGTEGDYYYVMESGKCRVERMIGGVTMLLAELKSGDAFGEEALVSDAKRNATVTMKADGALLRLDKQDFIGLLKEPLLQRVSFDEARQRVAMGGQWIDVRYPSEYQYDKLPGAINIPLAEVRNAFDVLNKGRDYVVYCQSERRSSAAAFLLAQRGYKAYLLGGGLWNTQRSGA
jgi:rhodanese-related sulfurtransferase